MTTINTEGDILAVIRELETSNTPLPIAQGAEKDPSLDPVALRDSIKNKLEFVTIVKKTNLSHLVEGCFNGKSIDEVKKELCSHLDFLNEYLEGKSANGVS